MVKTKLMILLVCAMSWPLMSWGASDANANDTGMNGANVSNNSDSATITDIKQQLATLNLPQQRIDFLKQQLQQSAQWPIEQQGQLLHLLAIEQEVKVFLSRQLTVILRQLTYLHHILLVKNWSKAISNAHSYFTFKLTTPKFIAQIVKWRLH